MVRHAILINRAPVLTLWTAVVAERLGFKRDEALSLGKALAGLNAQTKGRRLGIYRAKREEIPKARKHKRGEEFWIDLMGRSIPAQNTGEGVRAVTKGKAIEPEGVEMYLRQRYGDDLEVVQEAMMALAEAFDPDDLADKAFRLYEQFRPAIPSGKEGWGAKGELDLDVILSLRAADRGPSKSRNL